MSSTLLKAFLLLFVIAAVAPSISAQKELSKPLPENTWLVQSAFEERLPCSYHGPAEFKVPVKFLAKVIQLAETKGLPLYADPELSQAWDLTELRKAFMGKYNQAVEYQGDDFDDWGSEMDGNPDGKAFFALVADDVAPGTAGVVERFSVESGKVSWKREALYLSWEDWENLKVAVEVFVPIDEELIPWEMLEFQQNASGFSEVDAKNSLQFHQYSFYPEKIVSPGQSFIQTLSYYPLPGKTPDLLFSEWEEIAGGDLQSLLQRQDGEKPDYKEDSKGPYVLSCLQKPSDHHTLNGLVNPQSSLLNQSFLEEYIPQLMEKAFQGKLNLYLTTPSAKKIKDPIEELIELEDLYDEGGDWDDDSWGSELSPEERQAKLDSLDYSAFDSELKVIGQLVKRGKKIEFSPEFIEVTYWLPSANDAAIPFARLKVDEVKERFNGMSLGDFLNSSSCHLIPRQIAGQDFSSVAEGFYVGWFLENDWENIPTRTELEKLSKANEFKEELEKLYR